MSLLAQISNINSPANRFPSHTNLVGDIVSRVLLYAIVISGLVFFVRLLIAGFNFLTSLGEPAKIETAKNSLTHALVGLVIVLATFFIAQIIQVVFGIKII